MIMMMNSTDKKKNNKFIDFKVYFIHSKLVPLLNNTVLILCYEGDGLVGIYRLNLDTYMFK